MTHISTYKDGKDHCKLESIIGDCLEKAGLHIPHGGFAIIRSGLDIKVGDLVHCGRISGETPGMIKQVKSITNDSIIVGTAYVDSCRDFTFEAAEIYGVVTEVFDKVWHHRVYVRKDSDD